MKILNHFLAHQSCIILDGGLATYMEELGADFNDPLWSARILTEDDTILRSVYKEYLAAGADIICTASYQATIDGFLKKGLSYNEAVHCIEKSVAIAKEERDRFWHIKMNQKNRRMPLVAASIGPYGAYLADGSEYSGQYTISEQELILFHEERMHILERMGPDLFAFETIPQLTEVKALSVTIQKFHTLEAWLSLSCLDEHSLVSGDSLQETIGYLNQIDQIFAVGLNCIAPQKVQSILSVIQCWTDKALIVYPNKGEKWNAEQKCWIGDHASEMNLAKLAKGWVNYGAQLIGGCCRTSPNDIHQLRNKLLAKEET